MGRSRGLTGAPAFASSQQARALVRRLATSPMSALALAIPATGRTPLGLRDGTGWQHGADDVGLALERTLAPRQSPGADESADELPRRRGAASSLPLPPPTRIPQTPTARSETPVQRQSPRPTQFRPPATTTLVAQRQPSDKSPTSPHLPPHTPEPSSAPVTTGTRTATPVRPAPARRHAAAEPVTISGVRWTERSSPAGSRYTLRALEQLATSTRSTTTPHPVPASERTSIDRPLDRPDATPAKAPLPLIDSAASPTPRPEPQPFDNGQPPRARVASEPASRPAGPAATERIRGLAGLASHFAPDSDPTPQPSQSNAITNTATTAVDDNHRTGLLGAHPDHPADHVADLAFRAQRRSAADPLAEVEMGITLAGAVCDALCDEARRAGIVVERAL